jgi:hypothetical protein
VTGSDCSLLERREARGLNPSLRLDHSRRPP